VRNQYGTTSSHLHGGLPTDRCTAEWWISSPRVKSILNGAAPPREPAEARISVPADIAAIRENEPSRAREIQLRISQEFDAAFERDLAVVGFERSDSAGTYLLGTWQSK